jgi:general secretion pathway protein E/type IV pilus assembly protein PilB
VTEPTALAQRARTWVLALAEEGYEVPGLGEEDGTTDRARRFRSAFLARALRAGLSPEAAQLLYRQAVGLGPLEPFLRPEVEELVIRGRRLRVLYRDGRREEYPDLLDPVWVRLMARRVADATHRPLGGDRRFVTTDLKRADAGLGRVRVAAVEGPEGTAALNLRLFPARPYRLEDLGLPPAFLEGLLLRAWEPGGLLIAGPFAAGKTTLLNALLLRAAQEGYLVAVVEGFGELELPAETAVRVEATDPRLADQAMAEAVLRMRADILAIGEITAPEEARRFLWAAQVGRPVWGTIHGATFAQARAGFFELCSRAGMIWEAIGQAWVSGVRTVVLLDYRVETHRRAVRGLYDGEGNTLWTAEV